MPSLHDNDEVVFLLRAPVSENQDRRWFARMLAERPRTDVVEQKTADYVRFVDAWKRLPDDDARIIALVRAGFSRACLPQATRETPADVLRRHGVTNPSRVLSYI